MATKPTADQMGRLPIHYAAHDGNDTDLTKFIAAGQDVNSRENGGWTPLHFAAQKGWLEATRILLTNGAEVDATNNKGETPLYLAVKSTTRRDIAPVIELLRQHGADVNHEVNSGYTPLSYIQMIENEKKRAAFADLL